ncbi:MAG: tRNA CCA-pyrophosphorylase [Deltaproteobacteria bacterium]|nr:MAG: tRNA CCA-pyrophosphorylase [Deltaproteobacteria bacterium]
MIDPRDYLAAGQQLHGHKCPAMPLGLRAGAAAMNALGVERSKDGQLLALVELGEHHCAHCFADGVQMITGCTFGKGNIQALGYGKFGLTLVDKATGRAVRVVPKAEAQLQSKQTPFFIAYRQKGIPASQVPPEVVAPLIEKVMGAPDEAILRIGEIVDHPVAKPLEHFASFVCEACGDMVIETYGRLVGDRRVCIPCEGRLRAEAAG